jgi:hypothetical protein
MILLVMAICLLAGILAGTRLNATTLTPRFLPDVSEHGTRPDPPSYTFSRTPVSVLTSYWDYMIGGYHTLPLRLVPQSAEGGYFLTFLGKRAPTSHPRAFYAYLEQSGLLTGCSELHPMYAMEGWSAVDLDPLSGKPFYAWQRDGDNDGDTDICSTTDAFIVGIPGLMNDIQVPISNPVTITAPSGGTTTNNVFLGPMVAIGPSPFNNKRRAYIAGKNTMGHNSQSQNVYIAYTDFNANDIENGEILTWNHTSIPELDDWNAGGVSRNLQLCLAADELGNLYVGGYFTGSTSPQEADLLLFRNTNFGQGAWNRIDANSHLPAWNPPVSATDSTGYFRNDNNIPYQDNELYWGLMNSGHFNISCDHQNRLRIGGLWALCTTDGAYYPALQFAKSVLWQPATGAWHIKEIYPAKDPSNDHDSCYQPWDNEAPWGVVDGWGNDGGTSYPLMNTAWPFPHWDAGAHDDAMMYHYNNLKITDANEQGMMAAVWQDSKRARAFNYYQDADFAQYANTPEIRISVSANNGASWSQPIVLNNVDTPQLAGKKPMWVYPADKVRYMGTSGNDLVGKLGLMFYNDYTWGANSISPPYHANIDGGQVMFMELQITFPSEPAVLPEPTFFPAPGAYEGPRSITITCDQPGAMIHYTTDGTEPSIVSPIYHLPLFLPPGSTLLRARAFQGDNYPSPVTSGTYEFSGSVPAPAFSHPSGLYQTFISLMMSSDPTGIPIRYTTDGSDPDASSWLYTSPIPLHTGNYNFRARCLLPGWQPSAITTAEYFITGSVPPPIFFPNGGVFQDSVRVSISISDPLALVFYSFDGNAPDTNSTLYSGPFLITQSTMVHARAYRQNWIPSVIEHATFDIVVPNPDEDAVPGFTGFGRLYPNPFRSSTRIELGIEGSRQDWTLKVFNLRGEIVLRRDGCSTGSFSLDWDGRDANGKRLPAGIYLLRFEAGDIRQTRKLMLVGE